MPVDARIALGVEPVKMPDFAQLAVQREAVMNSMADRAAKTRALNEQNTLAQIMRSPDFDFNNPEKRNLVMRYAPNIGPAVVKSFDDAQKAQADAKAAAFAQQQAARDAALKELFQYSDFESAEAALDNKVTAGDLTPEQVAAVKARMRQSPDYPTFAFNHARTMLTPEQMAQVDRSVVDLGGTKQAVAVPKYAPVGTAPVTEATFDETMTDAEKAAAATAAKNASQLESLPADGAGVVRMVNRQTGEVVKEIQGVPTGSGSGKKGGAGGPTSYDAKQAAARGVLTTIENLIGPPGAGKDAGILQAGESGLIGQLMSGVGGTTAYDVDKEIESIKANLGFDRLQQMRDESPTGGALGQIAVKELDALQNSVAAVNVGQKLETKRTNLERIRTHYTNWLRASEDAEALDMYAAKKKGTPRETVPVINSQSAYDALPQGAPYRDSSGELAFKGGL